MVDVSYLALSLASDERFDRNGAQEPGVLARHVMLHASSTQSSNTMQGPSRTHAMVSGSSPRPAPLAQSESGRHRRPCQDQWS